MFDTENLDPITYEWEHGERSSILRFSRYVEDLVDELKQTVPPSARSWDGQDKTWTISSDWVESVTEMAESAGLEEA